MCVLGGEAKRGGVHASQEGDISAQRRREVAQLGRGRSFSWCQGQEGQRGDVPGVPARGRVRVPRTWVVQEAGEPPEPVPLLLNFCSGPINQSVNHLRPNEEEKGLPLFFHTPLVRVFMQGSGHPPHQIERSREMVVFIVETRALQPWFYCTVADQVIQQYGPFSTGQEADVLYIVTRVGYNPSEFKMWTSTEQETDQKVVKVRLEKVEGEIPGLEQRNGKWYFRLVHSVEDRQPRQ